MIYKWMGQIDAQIVLKLRLKMETEDEGEETKRGRGEDIMERRRVCLLGYLSHGANAKLQLLLLLDPDVTSSIVFKHTLHRARMYPAWCQLSQLEFHIKKNKQTDFCKHFSLTSMDILI